MNWELNWIGELPRHTEKDAGFINVTGDLEYEAMFFNECDLEDGLPLRHEPLSLGDFHQP